MENRYAMRFPRVVIGFLSSMACGVLLTWSYFREPLMQVFPSWTTSQLSLIFTFHNVFVSLSMVCAPFLLKKVPTRACYVLAALCFLVGLGGFRFLPVDQPRLAYGIAFFLYGILAPVGCAIGCLTCYSVNPAWYPDKSAMVNGLMITGFNICPIVIGAVAGALLTSMNMLSAFFWIGVIIAALVCLSIPFGVFPTEQDHLPPMPVRSENAASREYATGEMLKSPTFWCIFWFHTFLFSVGLILADHAAGIARSFGAAALFGLLFAPAKGVACFFAGSLMEKISTSGAMYVMDVIVIGGALLLLYAAGISSTILVLLGLILVGLGNGGCSAVKAGGIRFFFGMKNFQQNFGVTNINILPAALIVYLASKVIEHMSGSYNGVFVMILILGVLALLCTVILHLSTRKKSAAAK